MYLFGAGHVSRELVPLLERDGLSHGGLGRPAGDGTAGAVSRGGPGDLGGLRNSGGAAGGDGAGLRGGDDPWPPERPGGAGLRPGDEGRLHWLHRQPPEGRGGEPAAAGGGLLPGGGPTDSLPHRPAHRRGNPGGDRRFHRRGADRLAAPSSGGAEAGPHGGGGEPARPLGAEKDCKKRESPPGVLCPGGLLSQTQIGISGFSPASQLLRQQVGGVFHRALRHQLVGDDVEHPLQLGHLLRGEARLNPAHDLGEVLVADVVVVHDTSG